MTAAVVAVTGPDDQAVAEATTGLGAVTGELVVRRVSGGGAALPADVDCVVRVLVDGNGGIEATDGEWPSAVPVVAFGQKDPATVASMVEMDGVEYVQRGGDEQFVVLAHRIRSMLSMRSERADGTITQLQEISRDLMQAPSRESVSRVTVQAIETVLGYDMAVVRLYEPDEQVLEPVAISDTVAARMEERPTYALDEGHPGKVFASGEPAVYDDVEVLEDEGGSLEPVRSAMYLPVGVHGTLSIGADTAGAFDDVDRQMAALLATNAAAACNRARREQEARQARERIATILDRIEGLVQNTVEVLVEARTREEVERGVCTQLADANPYVFACLSRPDVREETLVVHEWAGDTTLESDEVVSMNSDVPSARAYATGESQVVDADALTAAAEDGGQASDGDENWLGTASQAGVESMMAIPLGYTDSSYGVLSVCANQADAFDRREQVVLEALGRAVANTINAIERGRILAADQVIELAFTVEDEDLLFSRLSADTDVRIASAGTVTQEDGALRIYLTATGADSETVLDVLDEDSAVTDASLVAEHDGECLFDVTVSDCLVETLVDHGAVPKRIESERAVARYTIELPYESDAREVFGLVEQRYDSTDLVGYHEHERPVHTQQEFRAALADRFTARQETALRTAYLGGFFEQPRQVDGGDLAEGMGIARPTYHQHLRAAQQKVFEELFDPQG